VDLIEIGDLEVSRFIIGGNPFSGFSHQSPARDEEMADYYTVDRIKRELRKAEELGVNTVIARADRHIIRLLREYWNEGGKISWIAQTCPELGTVEGGVRRALDGGASACYIHGGLMDNLLAREELDAASRGVELIKEAGLPAGVAGHNPQVHRWAEDNLDLDFYMCSYYNPTDRSEGPEHDSEEGETFSAADKDRMTTLIPSLSKPVVHYKVMAAGRTPPEEALREAISFMRPGDAVCVGIFAGDDPDMLREDVAIFERYTLSEEEV